MIKKILNLIFIFIISTLLFSSTMSYFTDVETTTGNTFLAGTIDLKIDCESHWFREDIEMGSIFFAETDLTTERFFNWDDIKPGDYGEATISMHVQANDAYVFWHIKNPFQGPGNSPCQEPTPDNGELAEYMNILIWSDQGKTPGFGNDQKEWTCTNNDNCEEGVVVHTYGDEEESGTVNIPRSDGTLVPYDYEVKPSCVKFEDADPQLGEDETTGLIDTFNITFYGGTLPINGHVKTGAGEVYFTINSIGEEIEIYYYDTLTYIVRLVDICGNTFSFEIESITKPGNTGLSHVEFCFTEGNPPNGECEGGEGDNIWQEEFEPIIFQGTMQEFIETYETQWIGPEYMESFVTHYIGWAWEVPVDTGNIIQGDILTFDVEFYAEQSVSNPNPQPPN